MKKVDPFIYEKYDPFIPEQWKPIQLEGVKPDHYFVSDAGRVKTKYGVIVKPVLINSGYYTIRMTNGKSYGHGRKYVSMLGHRLVMKVFNDTENFDELTVNHINHDKSNNCLYNLNYMTQRDNNEDSIQYYHFYGKDAIYNATFTDEQLVIIWNELKKGTSYSDILKLIGIEDTPNNRDYVGNIKRGKTYKRQLNELKLRKLID